VLNPGFSPQPFWDMKAPDGVCVCVCVCVCLSVCRSVCMFIAKSGSSLVKEPSPNVICVKLVSVSEWKQRRVDTTPPSPISLSPLPSANQGLTPSTEGFD